jgi:hypothetical protein
MEHRNAMHDCYNAVVERTIEQLAFEIDLDRIRRARERPEWQKLRAGGELFDDVCERMKSGIRYEHPEFDEAAVLNELRRRLEISRKLEAMG